MSTHFARSGGPGGQNVNKLNTKAILRFAYRHSRVLSSESKRRLEELFPNRVTDDGDLLLSSERYRSQKQNLEDCWEKLEAILVKASTPPKKRTKTKPSKASRERRMKAKKVTGDKKRSRRQFE
ncbi:MAG: aminoacyl-tRNA hydrolase [Deltaproteobacteria bacterium]|nr:aminoacyl-tRNA hydrolase [Deltaproteobacteria bacterium]